MKLCERYCRAVRLICVCGTSLWSVNLRTVCSSSLTQHPHKNTHSSSKLLWAFPHTHFITPLQGLHPLTSRGQKSIYYLPLHNSPGRFILMPPAFISFLFLWVSTPLQLTFFFVILKESTPLCNMSFSLHIFESLCKTKRKKQSRSGPVKECLNTCSPPNTQPTAHTLSECQGRDW